MANREISALIEGQLQTGKPIWEMSDTELSSASFSDLCGPTFDFIKAHRPAVIRTPVKHEAYWHKTSDFNVTVKTAIIQGCRGEGYEPPIFDPSFFGPFGPFSSKQYLLEYAAKESGISMDQAVAFVRAIRDPSWETLKAGFDTYLKTTENGEDPLETNGVRIIWDAMIGGILEGLEL